MGDIIRDTMAMGPVEQKDVVILLLGGESNGRRLASWLPSSSTTSEAITCGAFQVAIGSCNVLEVIELPFYAKSHIRDVV